MVRRAQASIEFLMVTGLSMALLVAGTFFIFDFTQANADQNALQQAAQVGYSLVDESANVYVYGEGSFVRFAGSLPDSIQDIYVVDENTIVFDVITRQGITPVQVFSPIPINGTTVDEDDPDRVSVSPTSVHSGRMEFRITSKGSWVEIRHNV